MELASNEVFKLFLLENTPKIVRSPLDSQKEGLSLFRIFFLRLIKDGFINNMMNYFLENYSELGRFTIFFYYLGRVIELVHSENQGVKIIELLDYFANYIYKFDDNMMKETSKISIESFAGNYLKITINSLEILFQNPNIEILPDFVLKVLGADFHFIGLLLKTNSLEKKIIGMRIIGYIINSILVCEKQEQSQKEVKFSFAKNKRPLLNKFLEEINIFNYIFGENIHEAILKKSSIILIYLYMNESLKFDQIDLIWKIAQDKHEALSEQILSLMSEVISSLTISHAKHFLNEISHVPFKDINNVTLKILESISLNKQLEEKLISEEVKENEKIATPINLTPIIDEKCDEGINLLNAFQNNQGGEPNSKETSDFKAQFLKLLWRFCSDSSIQLGLQSPIIEKSRSLLSKILIKKTFRSEMAKYMKKCIISIANNHSILNNLSILEQILKNLKSLYQSNSNTYEEQVKVFSAEIKDFKGLIMFLDKQYNITSVLLISILEFKKNITTIVDEMIVHKDNDEKMEDNSECVFDILNKYDENRTKNNELINLLEKDEAKEVYTEVAMQVIEPEIIENINAPQEIGQVENMNETQSTEKSMDKTISTISTDISNEEQSKIFLIKEFIEKYKPNLNQKDSCSSIYKNFTLNFSNQNYFQILSSIFEFHKFLIINSDLKISQPQIDYLYIVLVDMLVDIDEANIFYNQFSEIVKYQFLSGHCYLEEENIHYLLFDVILKIDFTMLPYSAMVLFKNLFFLVNSNTNNLIIMNQKIVSIACFPKIVGFEALWKIFMESSDKKVIEESQNMIINIINIAANDNDALSSIFDRLFNELTTYQKILYSSIDKVYVNNAKKLFVLLSILNSMKQKLNAKRSEEIKVSFINNYSHSSIKCELLLSLDITIKELKKEIAEKLLGNPNDIIPIDDSSITLIRGGNILINDKLTLRDIKYFSEQKIFIAKGYSSMSDLQLDDDTLNELVFQIKSMFENLSDDVLKRALKKNSYRSEDTIVYLLEETNIETIMKEIEDENLVSLPVEVNKDVYNVINVHRLELLIGFLELNIEDISEEIWKLVCTIKFPEELVSKVLSCEQGNLENLFSSSSHNNLLLFMKIINCAIFDDITLKHIAKESDSKKTEWKKMILTDPNSSLLTNLVISKMATLGKDLSHCSQNKTDMEILTIASKWLHHLFFSCCISSTREKLENYAKNIIQKRPYELLSSLSKEQNQKDTSKCSTPSKQTPTFGSPHSSFSEGVKNKKGIHFYGLEEFELIEDPMMAEQFIFEIMDYKLHQYYYNYLVDSFISIGEKKCNTEDFEVKVIEVISLISEIK